jgi:hypothetical protein
LVYPLYKTCIVNLISIPGGGRAISGMAREKTFEHLQPSSCKYSFHTSEIVTGVKLKSAETHLKCYN